MCGLMASNWKTFPSDSYECRSIANATGKFVDFSAQKRDENCYNPPSKSHIVCAYQTDDKIALDTVVRSFVSHFHFFFRFAIAMSTTTTPRASYPKLSSHVVRDINLCKNSRRSREALAAGFVAAGVVAWNADRRFYCAEFHLINDDISQKNLMSEEEN